MSMDSFRGGFPEAKIARQNFNLQPSAILTRMVKLLFEKASFECENSLSRFCGTGRDSRAQHLGSFYRLAALKPTL